MCFRIPAIVFFNLFPLPFLTTSQTLPAPTICPASNRAPFVAKLSAEPAEEQVAPGVPVARFVSGY